MAAGVAAARGGADPAIAECLSFVSKTEAPMVSRHRRRKDPAESSALVHRDQPGNHRAIAVTARRWAGTLDGCRRRLRPSVPVGFKLGGDPAHHLEVPSEVVRAALLRTARLIMRGEVCIP